MKQSIKPTDAPAKSRLPHGAKMGLLITLFVLIGVVIWVVVELKMYQS